MRIYQAGDLQIYDLSGKKGIEQLKKEFGKNELIDITESELSKLEKNYFSVSKIAEREALIRKKIREMAKTELIKEGKIECL